MSRLVSLFLSLAFFLGTAFTTMVQAEPQNNDRALAGVDQATVLFDITLSDPAMLSAQMNVIRETYRDLEANGLTPKMVLAFHGRNVHFLTRHLDTVPLEDLAQVETFNDNLSQLIALEGVRVEACAIAIRLFGADREAMREGVQVVGNTYISNMGYDKQGYTVIGVR
ncbi:DsrE family protein [Thiomicrospira sp. WB1]|jgi:intracellular sulfur oxidation DsrE/DsrF family protein|uniref:DsrE family protein n=1 Tax=Thiomicrospira sp. WB1 TaxID=1685380 RepID=UPI00074ADB00|nr:DsrE family protein [Thiomicrospira sp. WB1]KUJ72369.1 hypothetical protein AVO41_00705 [Thiomicrospira sp. WB1]